VDPGGPNRQYARAERKETEIETKGKKHNRKTKSGNTTFGVNRILRVLGKNHVMLRDVQVEVGFIGNEVLTIDSSCHGMDA
jgi:hypothetical protein